MSDDEDDIAACICRHSAEAVGGVASGPQPGQILVTIHGDGVLCYDTATKVSRRRMPLCMHAALRNEASQRLFKRFVQPSQCLNGVLLMSLSDADRCCSCDACLTHEKARVPCLSPLSHGVA